MKNYLYLIVACLCFSCTDPTRHAQIIFVFDKLDETTIREFRDFLDPMVQVQPNVKKLNLTVYTASMNDNDQAISTSFNLEHYDQSERETQYQKIMAPLKEEAKKGFGTRNLLHVLKRVYSSINDPKVDYHVIIVSQMLENSGQVLDPNAVSDSRASGHFRFVNNDGECISSEVNAAFDQLGDSSSWINRHLVCIKKEIPEFSRCKVKTIVYKLPANAYANQEHRNGNGADDSDINKFWRTLFDEMKISYDYLVSPFDMDEVNKLIE